MALIYKPLRQFMRPCDTVIDPKNKEENVFSLTVDGQICTAYRFVVYDLRGNINDSLTTGLVELDTPLYDGDTLEHEVSPNSFTAGETYRWQVCLLASKMAVESVDATEKTYKVANHNLVTGDSIFVFSSGSLPAELTAWKLYYIRRIDKDNIALFEYIDGAKNDAGRVEVTAPADGATLSIYNGVQSEHIVFDVYDSPTLSLTSEEITGHEYTWKPEYSHPQGVMVNHWEAFIADPNSAESDIVSSGDVYSSKIEWKYDGLMSGTTYWVWFKIVTNIGQTYYSPRVPFRVVYSDVSVGMVPSATNSEDESHILVRWSSLIENIGKITGDYSFIDYLDKPNNGLYLHAGAELSYEELKVNAEESSVPMFMWTPRSSDFNGVIMKAENSLTTETLEIGYDSTLQCFWFSINGNEPRYNAVHAIYPNTSYAIGMAGEQLVVNVVGNVEVNWNE